MIDALQVLMAVLIVILAGICTWLDWKLDGAKNRISDADGLVDYWRKAAERNNGQKIERGCQLDRAVARARDASALLEARLAPKRGRPSREKDLAAMREAVALLKEKQS